MITLYPPFWLAVGSTMLASLLLLDAIRRTDWRNLHVADHGRWAVLSAITFIGHQMSISVSENVELHYLGAAALCLMLGYSRAMISMALVFAGDFLLDPAGSLGMRFIVGAALPIVIMYFILRFSQRYLPANPFVFLLGAGFLGLFLTYTAEIFVSAGIHAWLGSWPHDGWSEALPFALLLASGETVLEGMLITVLAVYAPRWVRLFDDNHYLRG